MSEGSMINKLIILYMLSNVDFPVTSGQVMDFILGAGYMDYVTLQELLSELIESGLISSEKKSTRLEYRVTPLGRSTTEYLQDRLSYEIRREIKSFLDNHALAMKNEILVEANYYKTTNHEYEVSCSIKEGKYDLIRLNVTFPTSVQAEVACLKWKDKNEKLYAHIMKELL